MDKGHLGLSKNGIKTVNGLLSNIDGIFKYILRINSKVKLNAKIKKKIKLLSPKAKLTKDNGVIHWINYDEESQNHHQIGPIKELYPHPPSTIEMTDG